MRMHPLATAAAVGCAVLLRFGVPLHAEPALNPGSTAPAPPAVRRDPALRQTPVVEAVKRVRAAVVNIHSERTVMGPTGADELLALAPSQNRVNGMGTGIIIDPRGYIVTNQHVVEDVSVIRVRLADGATTSARVLARDPETDLALLKIDVGRPLPVMPLGTATDLQVGETVIAVGNAYGYEHTVTVGVVSAVGRDVTLNKEVSYKSLIQTCASINPGNSGGPLVNIYGDLVGVNVAIRAGAQGIGFAIPVDTMIRVAGNLMATRVRTGPDLGLGVRDEIVNARDDSGPARQAVVERVDASSPAGKAGVRRGDVVVHVGETAVASGLDVERALLGRSAGDKVPVVLKRGGAEQKVEVVLEGAARPASPAEVVWRRLGVRLQAVGAEAVARTHPQLHGGMLIAEVRPDGPAAKAGLQRGDILVGLHQWEMLASENVLFVLNHAELATFNPMQFFILRGGVVHRGKLTAE